MLEFDNLNIFYIIFYMLYNDGYIIDRNIDIV